MRVDIDTQQMRVCIALWRQELTLAKGSGDLISRNYDKRAQQLAGLSCTLTGWLDLLRLSTGDADDAATELRRIMQEVTVFKEWVDEAHIAVRLLQSAGYVRRFRRPE